MYMNMLQINELIEDIGPLSALTNNPIFGGYGIMAELSIPRTRKRSQLKTPKEMIGKKFGRLTVIGEAPFHFTCKGAPYQQWHCRCECGKELDVLVYALLRGNTKSCGCLHKDVLTTHDLTKHPLYKKWDGIKSRCYRKKDISYPHYGARGITMCDEWKENFQRFYDWAIMNGWKKGLQIDRLDNDGNYEPANCTFATPCRNSQHKRNAKLTMELAEEIRTFEKTHPEITNREIGEMYGVHANTISDIKFNRTWKHE
jgi:hypothetical protein